MGNLGSLERWLLRRTGCSAQAAELAQDTFVRLMVRRRQPAASSSMRHPRAFLATIARGLLIDEWRRRDIERAWLDTLAAQAEVGDCVLLSPACASLDMYKNYAHRAQAFIDAVQGLQP